MLTWNRLCRTVSFKCLALKVGLGIINRLSWPYLGQEVGVQQHVSVGVHGEVVAVGSELQQSSRVGI